MSLDIHEIRACWEQRGGWVDLTRSELDELLLLIAERDHYRDHSPSTRVSFEECEAIVCEGARLSAAGEEKT